MKLAVEAIVMNITSKISVVIRKILYYNKFFCCNRKNLYYNKMFAIGKIIISQQNDLLQ